MAPDVAVESDACAVGRFREDLVGVRAIEHQRVGAVAAFDDVAAFARVPDQRVVIVAAQQNIVGVGAGDGVVADVAKQRCRLP